MLAQSGLVRLVITAYLAVGCAMFIPAAHGFVVDDHETGRTFFQIGLLVLVITGLFYFTTRNRRTAPVNARSTAISLPIIFVTVPILAALPEFELISDTPFAPIFMRYVSSLTTTGFPTGGVGGQTDTILLWHSTVAWLGGFLMWAVAWMIAFPENAIGAVLDRQTDSGPHKRTRLHHKIKTLAPFYVILTAIMAAALTFMGFDPIDALRLAMGVLSTTAVNIDTPANVNPFWIEATIALFLMYAVSRRFFEQGVNTQTHQELRTNTELRLALGIVFVSILFVVFQGLNAQVLTLAWGHIFTAFSFLTTMGQYSSFLPALSDTPLNGFHLYLLGLAMIGGGVGTTAGGVKLIRMAQLLKNSDDEMHILVAPSHVASFSKSAARENYNRAVFAWTVFMAVARHGNNGP